MPSWFSPETIIAFLTGAGAAGAAWLKGRGSREERFYKRFDEELKELRAEVAECRKERPQMLIVTMGLKMLVPEMQRLSPTNPVLKQVANAFAALPNTTDDFADLIRQIDDVTPDYVRPIHGPLS